MKRFLTLTFFLTLAILSFANTDADSLLLAQLEPETNDAYADLLEASTLSEPQADDLKTYTNWAGETCIAEQPGNTRSHPYYNWKRDLTFAGVPIFLASFIIKDQKRAFRSARFHYEKSFKSEIDNYSQFFPYAAIVGMKAFGYQGRSSWDRFVVSSLAANAVMALAINATKYSVKEMRPDNSSKNSFPSGHTATAFTAATILHKEYGLTRSPWFSVAGYGVATATGVMRVLNNRHWISDVIAGAGLGILSTELGYWFADMIYKDKGICRYEKFDEINANKPSFFDIQMGIAMHSRAMEVNYDSFDGFDGEEIKLGTSSVVGAEGAYFFNKYLGVGGIARVTTTPVKNMALDAEEKGSIQVMNNELEGYNLPGMYSISTEDNNFVDASLDAGVYFNLPLSKHFSIGAKALCGARLSDGISYQATNGFRKPYCDEQGNQYYMGSSSTNAMPMWVFVDGEGNEFPSNELLQPGVSTTYNYALDDKQFKSSQYDVIKITGSNSFNAVFGLSFTYRYKNNFSWKIFADYDVTKSEYKYTGKMTSDEALKIIEPIIKTANPDLYDIVNATETGNIKKNFNFFTLGAAFEINF